MNALERTTCRMLRLDTWPGDPSVGHLVVLDSEFEPRRRDLDLMVSRARACGYTSVRTSALFPPARRAVERLGFDTIDTLALLRLNLSGPDPVLPGRAGRGSDDVRHPVRRLPRRRDADAAEVDRIAFGPGWGNDADGIRAIRRATPRHRARAVSIGRSLAGFAIGGLGAHTGYLQRLAVHPDHRRVGIADALVADLVAWFRTEEAHQVLVNTGLANRAALGLYERHGFVELPNRLVVAELVLPPAGVGR